MRVVYLPLYVPYTLNQIGAHILVLAATVLLAVSFTSKSWSETEIRVDANSNAAGVKHDVNIHNSLRAVSLERCEGMGTEPYECIDIDLVFEDCTPSDIFCDIAPSAHWCYGLSIAAFVLGVLATLVGLFRPKNQVHVLGVAIVLVSSVQILYSSVTHSRYTEGMVAREREMYQGFSYYYRNVMGWSFYVSMTANFLLLIACALSYGGYYKDMKKDAALEGSAVGDAATASRRPSTGPQEEMDGRYSPEDAGGEFGLVTALPATQSFPIPT